MTMKSLKGRPIADPATLANLPKVADVDIPPAGIGCVPVPVSPATPAEQEARRIGALHAIGLLDTEPEGAYDELVELAAAICEVPISLISLVDEHRQWFKSRLGLEATQTSREVSFCSHAIRQETMMEIPDALQDPRFAENPLVTGSTQIRFYAGCPISTSSGERLGTLCVIDRQPRQLTALQRNALQVLSHQVMAQIELKRQVQALDGAMSDLQQSNRLLQTSVVLADQYATEAKAASAASSSFLRTISHEIRTPMNGVLGMVQLLMTTDLSPEQRRYSEVAQSSGQTLLALINDVLDLSKIEAGQVLIESMDFDLLGMVRNVSEVWCIQAEAKGINLRVQVAAETPHYVRGDPNRVCQVLNNLIGNAVKFTQSGEVALHVELVSETTAAVTIRFAVADTGIGVPSARIPALFAPFVQADVSTSRKYGGSGLGLAICKQLAELMGGQIGMESQEGRGSVFWFTVLFEPTEPVPIPRPAPGTNHTVLPDVAEQNKRLQPARILVVDDNATNRLVAVAQLKKLGYKADEVTNGAESLVALEQGSYELILMDCEMPVMDGFEATWRIRQSPKGTIPIVALTANAMMDDRERCTSEGMDDFLAKPVDMHRLAELLIRWKLAPDSESKNRAGGAATQTVAAPELAAIFAGDAFLERLMGDRQLAEIVMKGFLEDFPSLLESLHSHFAEMTPGAVIQAHSLKGAAATVSATRLSSVARELELAAGEGNWERCRELLPNVTHEFALLKGELKRAGWL